MHKLVKKNRETFFAFRLKIKCLITFLLEGDSSRGLAVFNLDTLSWLSWFPSSASRPSSSSDVLSSSLSSSGKGCTLISGVSDALRNWGFYKANCPTEIKYRARYYELWKVLLQQMFQSNLVFHQAQAQKALHTAAFPMLSYMCIYVTK